MAFLDSLGRGLSAFGAGVQGRGQEFLQGLNQDRQQAMLKDAQRVQQDLAAGNVAGARKLLKRRVELISKLGGDPSDTAGLLSQIDSGDVEGALGEASTLVSFAQQQGFLPKPEKAPKPERKIVGGQIVDVGTGVATDIQGFKPDVKASKENRTSSARDFDQFKQLEAKANKTGDPADVEAAEQFGRQSRFLRLSEEDAADLKVSSVERKEIAKASTKRKQGFIDTGITSADSTATIRRSLDLINQVKTGGFSNVSLKAKQLLGIEGADELELTTNMGINVLSQLRPVFGAAFTEREGESLKKISAGFGRSVAGNKRLMEQALKIADRAARRGLAAAIDQGDEFTAGEIREALRFDLGQELQASDEEAPGDVTEEEFAAPQDDQEALTAEISSLTPEQISAELGLSAPANPVQQTRRSGRNRR